MRLRIIQQGSNQTLLKVGEGVEVLFSYETPVAGRLQNGEFVRTEKRYSSTTTKHVNAYLEGCPAREVPEDFFYNLLEV